jgi:hypothetical protein
MESNSPVSANSGTSSTPPDEKLFRFRNPACESFYDARVNAKQPAKHTDR